MRKTNGRTRVLWRKELKENRWKLALNTALLAILAVVTAVAYDYLRSLMASSEASAEVPEMFRNSLVAQLGDYRTYIWMGWYGKSFYQFGAILAIIVGMGLFSSEAARGTVSFLLARPFSREEVFAVKFAAGAVALAVPALIATLLIVPTARIAGHAVSAALLLEGFPVAFSGVLVIFALSVVFSVLIDEPVKAGAASASVALLLSIPSWFESARHFSVFVQMQALPVLNGEAFPWGTTAAMLVAVVLLYYGALNAFRAREY